MKLSKDVRVWVKKISYELSKSDNLVAAEDMISLCQFRVAHRQEGSKDLGKS